MALTTTTAQTDPRRDPRRRAARLVTGLILAASALQAVAASGSFAAAAGPTTQAPMPEPMGPAGWVAPSRPMAPAPGTSDGSNHGKS